MLTPWPISSRQKSNTDEVTWKWERLIHCPFMGTESKRDIEEGGAKNGNGLELGLVVVGVYFLNCILAS